jgi:hypothetical protein
VGHPLWREDGSVFCICCWVFPTQSFLGPSPLVLATIFYCLRSETSHFVASYDSQGHGGGIRPRLHTGPSKSHCDWRSVSQSVSKSWFRATSWAHDQIYISFTVTVFFLGVAFSDERTSLSFVYAAGPCQRSLSRVRVPLYSLPYFTVSAETSLFVASYDSQTPLLLRKTSL